MFWILQKKKKSEEKISLVTCYDFWTAQIIRNTEIDAVLVGDSLAMVMHGYPNTLYATVDMMSLHTKAVVRGLEDSRAICDFRSSFSFFLEKVFITV